MMEETSKKFTKDELNTLKKLGLTDDLISNLGPDENPFKDTGLAGRDDINSVIEFQQKFYEDIQVAYKKHLASMNPMDRLVSKNDDDGASPGVNIFDLPEEFKSWNKKKQLEYQRKKMIKL
jgi:hypothetical protein